MHLCKPEHIHRNHQQLFLPSSKVQLIVGPASTYGGSGNVGPMFSSSLRSSIALFVTVQPKLSYLSPFPNLVFDVDHDPLNDPSIFSLTRWHSD